MSGIGNINNSAGVGYTEMTGLGLNSTTQDQVKLDAAVSDSMSQDITEALAQFRAEGNLNPTSAEMEARLSAVSDAARQNTINQAQQTLKTKQAGVATAQQAMNAQKNKIDTVESLLDGLRTILNANMSYTGQGATNTTAVAWEMTNAIAGDYAKREATFGKDIADRGAWAAFSLLNDLVPGWNGNLAAGYTGGTVASENSGYTNAQISGIISVVSAKLTALKGDTSFQTAIDSAQAEVATVQNNIAALQSGAGVVSSDASGLTAHQWLAREMGVQNPRSSYSLAQWGEIAQKLAVNAAKKRSELSLGNGGGIQQVNGQYFVNGQEMSLSQVNFCVRANQYQLIDQQIADQLDAIQRNNAKAKQAQAVLAAFKTYDNEKIGVDQSATTDAAGMINPGAAWGVLEHYLNTNFGVTNGSDPSYTDYKNMMTSGSNNTDAKSVAMKTNLNEFFSLLKAADPTFYSSHISDTSGGPPYTISGTISNIEFSSLKTNFGTYLQSNSTDNQVAQQRLEALNNTRQAILAGMSAFTQGQSQVTDRIGGNL